MILNAHEHFYERSAPQTSAGEATPDGIPQFIVGTGGAELRSTISRRGNSARFYNEGYDLLVLVLGDSSYRWAFVGTGGAIHDQSNNEVNCRS